VIDPVGQRRLEIFGQLLGLFTPGRLVDLGAGHGLFSIAAARAGWEVVAVDARTERNTPAPGVKWVESDVRDFPLAGFDLVACLGLFYHLTVEDQIDLLRRGRGTPMIVDTHLANGRPSHPLSDQVKLHGYVGRLFTEDPGYTSSWGNSQSFWPTPDSFSHMLEDAGFRVIAAIEPWYMSDRTFFLVLPGSAEQGGSVPLAEGWVRSGSQP